ncbi:MAG TPA: hypothetical protein VGJ60_20565 [Chloroflexota bacterium]
MPLQLVADDLTPLPPIFAKLRLVEADPDLREAVTYISIPAPQTQVRADGGYDIYPGSLFPGQVDKIRNHPHPQTPDAIMALETFLLGAGGPTFPGATFTGDVTAVPPAAFIGNGAVPDDGSVGQVLTKTGPTDYAYDWQTPTPGGLTLPLTQDLTFSPDATYSIGAYAASRPRRVYASEMLLVGNDPNALMLGAAGTTSIGVAAGALEFRTNNTSRWRIDNATGSFLAVTDNAVDIGASSANRPRTVYAATSFIGPGAVPVGGSTGQILSKSSNSDYALSWTTPATGVSWPLYAPDGSAVEPSYAFASDAGGTGIYYASFSTLRFVTSQTDRWQILSTGHLQTVSDNVLDIGASGANRPRDLYLGRNQVVGGTLTVQGNATLNGTLFVQGTVQFANQLTLSYSPLLVNGVGANSTSDLTFLTSNTSRWYIGGSSGNLLASADNAYDIGASAANRPANVYVGSSLTAPTVNASNVWTPSALLGLGDTTNGTRWRILKSDGSFQPAVDNSVDIGTSGQRPRDLYLGRNQVVGGTAQFVGNVGIGTAPVAYSGLIFQPTLTGANQFAFYAPLTFSTSGTGNNFAVYLQPTFAASTRTVAAGASFYADAPTVGAGVTVTGMYGLFVANQGKSGITNAYGLYIANQSGAATTNIGLYNAGTSQLVGAVGFNTAPISGQVTFGTNVKQTSGDATFLRLGVGAGTDPAYDLRVNGAMYVGGNILFGGSISTNLSVTAGGPVTGQYFVTSGNIEMGGELRIGPAGAPNWPVIRANPAQSQWLDIRASNAHVMVQGKLSVQIGANAYHDGSAWQRFDVAQAVAVMQMNNSGGFYWYTAPSGANPITLNSKMTLDNNGALTLSTGYLSVGTAGYVLRCGDTTNALYWDTSSLCQLSSAGNSGIFRFYSPAANTYFDFHCIAGGFVQMGGTHTSLQVGGQLQSNSGNLYLINTTTAVTSDSTNLLLYATGGIVVTRTTAMHVQNAAAAYVPINASAFTVNSTLKNKRDLSPLSQPASLAAVLDERVTPLAYTYLDDARYLGFGAEAMREVIPEVVSLDEQGDPAAINYGALVPVLWSAIRELSSRLAALENA